MNKYKEEWSVRTLAKTECGVAKKYDAGCRCTDCYQAWKERTLKSATEGTTTRYLAGCRCTLCVQAYSQYKARAYAEREEYRLKQLARGAKNRSAKHGTAGALSWEDLRALFARYDRCLACGTRSNLSVDHVVPQSRGGDNSLENCQVLCRSCNSTKGTKSTDYRAKANANAMELV